MCRASKAQGRLAITDEAKQLVREMADAFKRQLSFFERCSKLPADEAFTKASEINPVYEENLRRGPPEKLTFFDLCALGRLDPEAAAQRWSEIKQAAHRELRSGHRAAQAMEFQRHPWSRAQFLALRKEMSEDWQPRNGTETLLIDQMAMALTGVFTWQETLSRRT